jgi:hypothetical protein
MARADYFRQISITLYSRIRPPPGLPRGQNQPAFIFHYAGNGDFLSARIAETSGVAVLDDWFVSQLNNNIKGIPPIPVAPGNEQEFDMFVTYGPRR